MGGPQQNQNGTMETKAGRTKRLRPNMKEAGIERGGGRKKN